MTDLAAIARGLSGVVADANNARCPACGWANSLPFECLREEWQDLECDACNRSLEYRGHIIAGGDFEIQTRVSAQGLEKEIGKLSLAQREAIFPGPGNPAYASGRRNSMLSLAQRGIVTDVAHWAVHGKCIARLTPLGLQVRAHLLGGGDE